MALALQAAPLADVVARDGGTRRGQAEANRRLAESLNDRVIQYTFVQRLSDKISVALLPAGQGLILDPRSLLQPGAQPQPSPSPAP
ncbi:MAG: hypothetical protein M3301_07345 [Chloroflexota bacterium]|nr:hypothetical protein [Chloroflexota bacterium]